MVLSEVGVSPTARRSPISGIVMLPSGRMVASVVSPGFSHTLIEIWSPMPSTHSELRGSGSPA